MPDIAAGLDHARFPVIGRYFDPVQDALGRHDLIGAYHQQQIFGREHAVFRQDIQDGVLREERLGEVHKIGNPSVVAVRPVGRELKTVGRLSAALPTARLVLLDMARTGGVGIVLRERAVGDDEDLHVLVQSALGPKTVALIAVDLVERLLDGHATAFQFHMNERQTVDQDCDVIAGVMRSAAFLILVDDLQTVVVDVLFVDQGDVLGRPVLTNQVLDKIFLNLSGLLDNALGCIGDLAFEKAVPFLVREAIVVQQFQLLAEIGNERIRIVNHHVLIALFAQHLDESGLQRGLALIGVRAFRLWFILGHDSAFAGRKDDVVGAHGGKCGIRGWGIFWFFVIDTRSLISS